MSAGGVVVTGGCGYVGSVLVPMLQRAEEADQITLLDNLSNGSPRNLIECDLGADALTFTRGDVRNYGDVENAVRDADTVVHLAAVTGAASTHDREEETRAINLEGTENLLKAARKFDIDRFVFASSCNIYGRAEREELDETVEPDPINPYAQTKYEAEGLLEAYDEDYDIDTTALRMSTVYGYAPGIRFNLVVNAFVFRALTDRPLTVYGDGSNWRPFIHIKDAARALGHAVCEPSAWEELVYNVGSNRENYQITDIAHQVREALDRNLEIVYLEDEQPGPSYHVNFDRLEETTGFDLEWSLVEGIVDLEHRLTETDPRHKTFSPKPSGEIVHD